MARIRSLITVTQIVTSLGVLFAMLLPWHADHGSGLNVMRFAIDTKVAFGLNPFDPDYISVSQWWLMWIIPLVNLMIAFRAVILSIYDSSESSYNRRVLLVMIMAVIVVLAWYNLTFPDGIENGFKLVLGLTGVLAFALVNELFLPEKSPHQLYLESLPPDHPDRLWAGEYQICLTCGEFNIPGERTCRECRVTLLPGEQ